MDARVRSFVRRAVAAEEGTADAGTAVVRHGLLTELERAAHAEPALAVAIAHALANAMDAPGVQSLRTHAAGALALAPGPESALGAIEVTASLPRSEWERVGPPRALRRLAAMLAQAQPAEVLLEIAERFEPLPAHAELLSLLLHESVLRGIAVADHAPFVRIARDLRGKGHPLARLPIHRLAIEEGLPRRSYYPQGWSGGWSMPDEVLAPGSARDTSPGSRVRGWRVNDVTVHAEAVEMRACAVTMLEESNAHAEARVFDVAPSLPEDTAALLWSLGLDGLQGARDITVADATPAEVFRLLFGMAAIGGAYDQGLDGAWGRLHAWRSFAALCGGDASVPLDEIESRAKACRWRFFSARAPFYANVAWDAGIACLRDDTVAVLAVSDTD